jgi:hypothetical protein
MQDEFFQVLEKLHLAKLDDNYFRIFFGLYTLSFHIASSSGKAGIGIRINAK